MPFRDAQTPLRDIQESIDHINEFIGDMDFESYRKDLKTKSAVERQLQILAEAVIRLGDEAEMICPGPDWQGFRGMGNILRHGYHRVDDAIVWNTINEELQPMRVAVVKALSTPPAAGPAPNLP